MSIVHKFLHRRRDTVKIADSLNSDLENITD